MNNRYLVIITLVVLLSILSLLAVLFMHELTNQLTTNENSDQEAIKQGFTLVYNISGKNINNGAFVYDNRSGFYADLMPNYTMVLNQLSSGGGYSYHPMTDCSIHSQGIYITVHVITLQHDTWYTNITLTFYNGSATCGTMFGSLPVTDGSWTPLNSSLVISLFRTLNLTRQIVINTINSNTQSDICTECGIWPFWINPMTFKNGLILIPYNLDEGYGAKGLNGTATVIMFDNSIAPNISFPVSGRTFEPDQETVGSIMIPWEIVYSNLSNADLNKIVTFYHQENYSAIVIGGNVIVNYDPAFSRFDNTGLGWTLRNISYTYPTLIGNKLYNATMYNYVVQYGEREYIIASPPGICLYTKSGILLACNFPDSGGDLFSVLPTPIDRLFGVNFESQYYANQLYIKLVDISG